MQHRSYISHSRNALREMLMILKRSQFMKIWKYIKISESFKMAEIISYFTNTLTLNFIMSWTLHSLVVKCKKRKTTVLFYKGETLRNNKSIIICYVYLLNYFYYFYFSVYLKGQSCLCVMTSFSWMAKSIYLI